MDSSVLRIDEGYYDESKLEFTFNLNGAPTVLSLTDPEITGMLVFRRYFGKNAERLRLAQVAAPFPLRFYVFDFSSDAKGPHILEADDKLLIKEHRIYLYRDGIRVLSVW